MRMIMIIKSKDEYKVKIMIVIKLKWWYRNGMVMTKRECNSDIEKECKMKVKHDDIWQWYRNDNSPEI